MLAIFASAVGVATTIALFEWNYNREQALASAQGSFNGVSASIDLELDHILDPIERVIDGAAATIELINPSSDDFEAILGYLAPRLAATHYLKSLSFADSAGNYAFVSRHGELFEEAPPNVLDVRIDGQLLIRRGQDEQAEIRFILDGAGRIVSVDDRYVSTRDVRDSNWYQRSYNTQGFVHSDPFMLDHSATIGLRISLGLPSGKGVVSGEITLSSLGEALKRYRLLPSFRSVLFELKGLILASDEDTWIASQRNSGRAGFVARAGLSSVDSIAVAALSKEMASGMREGTKIIDIDRSGPWAIWLKPLSGGVFDGDFVATLVSADELFAQANRQFATNLIVILVGLIFGWILALWVSARIADPLRYAVSDIQRLTKFDIGERLQPATALIEIRKLNVAVNDLRIALQNFGMYVPSQLVQKLVAGKVVAEVSGRRQDITVLFTDIENFTTISEKTEAEELTQAISTYLGLVSGVLMHFQGTVDKFIGDAVMAFWNAPEPIENHAEVACLAALKARAEIHLFNSRRRAEGLDPFRTRFGLNAGVAVVGTIGSSERANYTAVGSVVNLASRIEGINKIYGTEILISGEVRDRLGPEFSVRPIDFVRAKGMSNTVQLYELLGHAGNDPLIAPHPECKMMIGSWLRAVDEYSARNWIEAIDILDEHLLYWPEDRAAHELRRRAESYRVFPPPADWDGIESLTSK